MSPTVSPQWLNDHLDVRDLIILDSSPQENKSQLTSDFEGVRIPGARFFDLKNNFSRQIAGIPNMLPEASAFEESARKLGINRSSRIVVYDNLGIYTSPRVRWMFRTMGHNDVAVLDGGLPHWIESGFETESIRTEEHSIGDFRATLNPHAVKHIQDIVDNLHSKKTQVIDARSSGRFDGTKPEPRQGLRSGHIPDSLNIPFQDVLHNNKFKDSAELHEVFKHVDPAKPLTFSCGSGLTACIAMLASELILDNERYLYDGSWTEWASANDLPVNTEMK